MLHLFKHAKTGKFDIALVVKGKFIVGSNQHYNRKSGAIGIIKYFDLLRYQDDTVKPSKVYRSPFGTGWVEAPELKPSKPYIPNKK